MKKLEYRDLCNHLSPAALDAYNDSDLEIQENDDGTLRVSLYGTDVIGKAWSFEDLEAFLNEGNDQTTEDFVRGLFESYTGNPEGLTVDQAADDLRRFSREGWTLPNDITPESFAELWNHFCAEQIADALRGSDTWREDLCETLCDLAGLLTEYREADGETFESVVFQAAEKLGVEIL